MYEFFEDDDFISPDGIQFREEVPIICFRCGVCCIYYRVLPSLEEAQRIANYTGLSLDEFIEQFGGRHWLEQTGLLLRQKNGACFFLEHIPGRKEWRCRVNPVKPNSCREWTPGLYRRECQRGLKEYWQLIVNPLGQVEGTEENLRDFDAFLAALTAPEKDTAA